QLLDQQVAVRQAIAPLQPRAVAQLAFQLQQSLFDGRDGPGIGPGQAKVARFLPQLFGLLAQLTCQLVSIVRPRCRCREPRPWLGGSRESRLDTWFAPPALRRLQQS